jgi:hypothetical protein
VESRFVCLQLQVRERPLPRLMEFFFWRCFYLTRVAKTLLACPLVRLKIFLGRSSATICIERVAVTSLALTGAHLYNLKLAWKNMGLSCETLGLRVPYLWFNLTDKTLRSDHFLLSCTFSPRSLALHVPWSFFTSTEVNLLT